jgi:succinate dehydrogenase / fumarate reductase flavoprotein subunit
MTTIPGLYAIGEANFSDHGANRLGASALMQGLADGYFILPVTIGDYLAGMLGQRPVPTDDPAFRQAEADVADQVKRLLATNGRYSVDHLHRELGKVMWERAGMARNEAGLTAAISDVAALRDDDRFAYVAGWEWGGEGGLPKLHREELSFEYVKLAQRSYK